MAKKREKGKESLASLLVDDLRENGPLRASWANYSALGNGYYHCHLQAKWVAVWSWKKGALEILIEYVGSRESAPY